MDKNINEFSLFQGKNNIKLGLGQVSCFYFRGVLSERLLYMPLSKRPFKYHTMFNVPAHRDFKFVCKIIVVTTLPIIFKLFLAGYVYLHLSCSQE